MTKNQYFTNFIKNNTFTDLETSRFNTPAIVSVLTRLTYWQLATKIQQIFQLYHIKSVWYFVNYMITFFCNKLTLISGRNWFKIRDFRHFLCDIRAAIPSQICICHESSPLSIQRTISLNAFLINFQQRDTPQTTGN